MAALHRLGGCAFRLSILRFETPFRAVLGPADAPERENLSNGWGPSVQVLLDKSQRSAQYSSAEYLHRAGVAVFIDDRHAIAHNKIVILDGVAVFTGSFNFSKAAEEKNTENLLLIHDAELAARYLENWDSHREHAEAYAGKDR